MVLRTVCLVAALVLIGPTGQIRAGASQATSMPALYAAYVAGQPARLAETFVTVEDFRRARSEIFQTVRDWRGADWRPSHASFLLELSFLGFQRAWDDSVTLLASARDMVLTRPDPPGRSKSDDDFEIAFHRAAVALLTGLGRERLDVADTYLTALEKRTTDGLTTITDRRLVDPRLSLMRGMILEIRTSPGNRPDVSSRANLSSMAIRSGDDQTRRRAEQALAFYNRVAVIAETAGEAAVRSGFLLHRLGQQEQALSQLALAAKSTDPSVVYWSQLFRGRTLEALDRTADAAAAYEEAARLMPRAQTPAIALTSLWQRHDRSPDALKWAAAMRSGSLVGPDPWWEYWSGDLRLLPRLVGTLRAGRP